MWFPYNLAHIDAANRTNDWDQIHNFSDLYESENAKFESGFSAYNIGKDDVIVTHHLPSYQSVPERFMGSAMNSCFVSNGAEKLIYEHSPRLWIHGHTHDSFDYMLGDTRVVCNPVGYKGCKTSYNKDLIVEI
jgi:Icc-related predicted phosphoesterase